jgi:small conductance mechanosensitive channel
VLAVGLLAQEVTPLDEACGSGDPKPWLCRLVFNLTDSTGAAETARWLDPIVSIALIAFGALLVTRVARRIIRRAMLRWAEGDGERARRLRRRKVLSILETSRPIPTFRRQQRAKTIAAGLASLASIVLWAVAAVWMLAVLGIEASALLTSAGLIGVALGFGAQNLLRDLIAGTFIIFEDQLGVGDVVDAGEASGVVEAVSLRTTRLRDVNGVVWHIPNGNIDRIGNMSQEWSRALLDISVAYDTDVALAESAIKEVADGLWRDETFGSLILAEPEVWGVEQLGADGIAIRLVVQTKPLEQWKVARELRARIKAHFDELGIEIPFPQRTIWHRGEVVPGRDAAPAGAEDGHGERGR